MILELAVLSFVCFGHISVDKILEILPNTDGPSKIFCAEKFGPICEYTTETYPYMDKIINVIGKTKDLFPNDLITKHLYNGNFYIEVFEIDKSITDKRYNHIAYKDVCDNMIKALKLTDDGSYYIEINMSSPDIYGVFKFEYGKLHFVCDQYYNNFFKKLKDISFCNHEDRVIYQLALYYEEDFADYDQYSDEELDDMLDEPDNFGDWRFLIIDGCVKSALYFDGYHQYDFISQKQIDDYNFFKQLPYQKSKYSTPTQWEKRLKSFLETDVNNNTYLNFKELN